MQAVVSANFSTCPRQRRWYNLIGLASYVIAIAPSFASAQNNSKVDGGDGGVVNIMPGCGDPPTVTTPVSPLPPEKTKFATSPGGVDMRSGTWSFENLDVSIGGPGDAGISLSRFFSGVSNGPFTYQPFGDFFTHNWDIQVRETRPRSASACYPNQFHYAVSIFYRGMGEAFWSEYNSNHFEQTSPSGMAELVATRNPSNRPIVYTFTARDGTVVNFLPMPSGYFESACLNGTRRCTYASKVTRPDGTIYSFGYDTLPDGRTKQLRSVESNRGYALLFEYGTTSNGMPVVTKVCALNLANYAKPFDNACPTGVPTATYDYTGNVQTSAVESSGGAWSFAQPSGNSFSVTRPGDSIPLVTATFSVMGYSQDSNADVVINSQSFANGSSYSYVWDQIPTVWDGSTGETVTAGGRWTDSENHQGVVKYGYYRKPRSGIENDPGYYITAGPEQVIDELNRITTGVYCPGMISGAECDLGNVLAVSDPEGNSESYVYGAFNYVSRVTRVAKPGSGLPSLNEDRGRGGNPGGDTPVTRSKPTTVTDAKGNVTSYTYDPVHGGVLTETSPAVAVGGFGSIRPVKRFTYTQRFAQTTAGTSPTGVYLLETEKTCRSSETVGASCQGGPSDEVATTYDYYPANLLLRSKTVTADGLSNRECYGYDGLGNRIWSTSPRGVCP